MLIQRRNRRRKFESSSPHRADVTLVITAISEDSPRRFNTAIDRSLRNQPTLPDPIHDFFPADHAAGTAQQEQDEIEDQRLGVQRDPVSSQLISFSREFKIAELIPHSSPVCRWRRPARRRAQILPMVDRDRSGLSGQSPGNPQVFSHHCPSSG